MAPVIESPIPHFLTAMSPARGCSLHLHRVIVPEIAPAGHRPSVLVARPFIQRREAETDVRGRETFEAKKGRE